MATLGLGALLIIPCPMPDARYSIPQSYKPNFGTSWGGKGLYDVEQQLSAMNLKALTKLGTPPWLK